MADDPPVVANRLCQDGNQAIGGHVVDGGEAGRLLVGDARRGPQKATVPRCWAERGVEGGEVAGIRHLDRSDRHPAVRSDAKAAFAVRSFGGGNGAHD